MEVERMHCQNCGDDLVDGICVKCKLSVLEVFRVGVSAFCGDCGKKLEEGYCTACTKSVRKNYKKIN